jgi:hypothetical protein
LLRTVKDSSTHIRAHRNEMVPTRADSSSSRSIGDPPSSDAHVSGASTQVDNRDSDSASSTNEKTGKHEKNQEYEERGMVEIDEDGEKRKVMLVVEQKSGKEMFKDIGGGPYTVPRWSVSRLTLLARC